ncbi:hypothetical protein A5766_20020 [Gordonia sp. 852002-51296_SCH5728562-b]|nr:hypothetical protein A5766_20020 [Gordonia sp. 852002-51296_SCH5728562-b]
MRIEHDSDGLRQPESDFRRDGTEGVDARITRVEDGAREQDVERDRDHEHQLHLRRPDDGRQAGTRQSGTRRAAPRGHACAGETPHDSGGHRGPHRAGQQCSGRSGARGECRDRRSRANHPNRREDDSERSETSTSLQHTLTTADDGQQRRGRQSCSGERPRRRRDRGDHRHGDDRQHSHGKCTPYGESTYPQVIAAVNHFASNHRLQRERGNGQHQLCRERDGQLAVLRGRQPPATRTEMNGVGADVGEHRTDGNPPDRIEDAPGYAADDGGTHHMVKCASPM